MPVIGGDLGAMSALAGRFTSAGAEFATQSQSITRRVGEALQQFTDQMRVLDTEARALGAEIDGEMKRLAEQAAGTVWTGTNRQKHDQIVAALDDDIVAIRTAIENFVTEASNVVNGALTTTMTTMQDKVTAAGAKAQGAAESFSASVTGQRNAFDQVMNG
jgi:hypothetical protein